MALPKSRPDRELPSARKMAANPLAPGPRREARKKGEAVVPRGKRVKGPITKDDPGEKMKMGRKTINERTMR